MARRLVAVVCVALVLCFSVMPASFAAEKESIGMKFKRFWRGLFNYSADVGEKSSEVVTGTGKKAAGVVASEVKRAGEVTSGEVSKSKAMIVEPLTGTAETVKSAAEGAVNIPFPKENNDIK